LKLSYKILFQCHFLPRDSRAIIIALKPLNGRTQKISAVVSAAIQRILDFLLPRSAAERLLDNADVQSFSRHTRPSSQNLPDIVSLYEYRDPLVKTLIWQVKFKGNRRLAKLAAELLYEPLLVELSEHALFEGISVPVIVPVPLATERLRERGFNQAQRIAEEMKTLDGGKNFVVATAVARIRETKSQTKSQNRRERLENLRGAFTVTKPREIANRYVIVLDDVATTGATIGEIRKVLMEAGAASVIGLTLAH